MSHPTTWEMQRWLAGELSTTQREALQDHLGGCPQCADYLASRQQEQAHLMERLPPETFAARISARAQTEAALEPRLQAAEPWWKRMPRLWLWLPATAAAAAVALLLLVGRGQPPEPGDVHWMGGQPAVRLVVQRGPATLSDAVPRVGDRVRYEVTLPGDQRGYAAVMAIQEGEVVALSPPAPMALPIHGPTWMPGSVALDPGGGLVRVLLFVRPDAFELAPLAEALRQAAPESAPRWPPGLVHTFVVDLGNP
jgi:anti-sigma factor RsiW